MTQAVLTLFTVQMYSSEIQVKIDWKQPDEQALQSQ